MPAGKYDLTIEMGATFKLALQVADASGAPRDLTGYSARMQVRDRFTATTAVLSLSSPAGGITIDVPSGTVSLRAEAVATAALTPMVGVYDVELQAPDGTVWRLLQGKATIAAEVTR